LNLNIFPNPIECANVPGGVNSVVFDHALGFLNAGHSIHNGDGLTIVHALAQAENIDVFHCHGLYPIGPQHFNPSYSRANEIVLRNALRAKLTICISEFSANILRHKLHIEPHVTRNGIWTKEYSSAGSVSGPVLFPKAGLDANARPDDMLWLRKNTDLPLLSIASITGISSTGPLGRAAFLETLRSCSIYLGTTKENNSMATMEAMISGVPVVGYANGFNTEWLINGTGCELVLPGDQAALQEAIRNVRSNWQRYSKAAREYAEIFDWQPVIQELLGLYQRVQQAPTTPQVSIVIPVHNYGHYLREAIDSALAQTRYDGNEVIVVDDASTDDSLAIANTYGERITVLHNKINLGVAETRNRGIRHAHGSYIVCLDADDRLLPTFVESHLAAFQHPEDAIAYAPIQIIDEHGRPRPQRLFHAVANPALQSKGRNQVPSCCMFRKSFWERAGGYDKRYTPAEDAHLWLKIFSLGGKPVQATTASQMEYRSHNDSLSMQGFPNWWTDHTMRYESPIVERDPQVTIILDAIEGAEQTLWSLEKQDYPNWSCLLPARIPEPLKKAFPWLNRSPSRMRSILHVKAGTVLPSSFLRDYMQQTPQWMSETRQPSLSPLSSPPG
jgi:GT2 family glycosyltransferase